MELAANKNAWVGALDTGEAYLHCHNFIMPHGTKVTPQCANLPYGDGVTAIELGPNADFRKRFATDKEMLKKQLADAIPKTLSNNGMIHCALVETANPLDVEIAPEPSLVVSVWGHDTEAQQNTRKHIMESIDIDKQGGDSYTVNELLGSQVHKSCDKASRILRRNVCRKVAELVTGKSAEDLYENYNFDHTHLTACADNEILFSTGQNIGNQAMVFHSPHRGATLFKSEIIPSSALVSANKLHITPSKDGRTVDFGNRSTLANGHESFATSDLHKAMHTAKSAMQCASYKENMRCATAVPTNTTDFVSINEHESTYRKTPPLQVGSQLVDVCDDVVHLNTMCTVFPPVQTQNGKLCGVMDCNTIEDVTKFTRPSAMHCYFENTPYWRQLLTDADPSGRPATMMNEHTEQVSSNKVTHWKINKDQFVYEEDQN